MAACTVGFCYSSCGLGKTGSPIGQFQYPARAGAAPSHSKSGTAFAIRLDAIMKEGLCMGNGLGTDRPRPGIAVLLYSTSHFHHMLGDLAHLSTAADSRRTRAAIFSRRARAKLRTSDGAARYTRSSGTESLAISLAPSRPSRGTVIARRGGFADPVSG